MPRKHVYCPKEVGKIHEILREHFRNAGPGSIKKAEDTFRLTRKYYSYNRKQATLDHGVLLATLQHLRVDPADFFAELYGLERTSRQDAAGGDARVPSAAKNAGGMVPTAGPELAPAEFAPEDAAAKPVLEAWLAEMDELRYDDPEAALAALRSRIEDVPRSLFPRYLAVCGSCHRLTGGLKDSEECFAIASRLLASAEDAVPDEELADHLQRRSYVASDVGDYARALELAERATGIRARSGDTEGFAKALVDQGRIFFLLNRFGAAQKAFDLAAKRVPESATRTWFAIHQILTMIHERRDRIDAALRHARKARKLAPSSRAQGFLAATEARILQKLGRLDLAEKAQRRAVESLAAYPLDGLLALTELVRILTLRTKLAEASATAARAVSFFGRLKGNRLAEAAVVELYRLAAEQNLRLSVLDRILGMLDTAAHAQRDDLSERLRRARAREGLSRRDAARQMQLPRDSLGKIESGFLPGKIYEDRILAWIDSKSPEITRARSAVRERPS